MLGSNAFHQASSSLREATAWLYLRQDIYISLVTQQAPRTDLQDFSSTYSVKDDDDFGWAKQIVFLVAKVLAFAFRDDSVSLPGTQDWNDLNQEVEQWVADKPESFNPIFLSSRDEENQRLPEIWMLSTVHGT